MHCKQARQQIDRLPQPTPQLNPELTRHTAQCQPCANLLEERTALRNALASLRAETASLGPSTHVEQQVLAALDANTFSRHRNQPTLRWIAWRWITASALVFAALLISAVLLTARRSHSDAPIAEIPHEEPFIAMPDVSPPAPHERTTVVRTRVSSQIVQLAGLAVQGDPASATLADVVLGQDGRMVAFRPVSQPNPVSGKRIN